MIASNKNKNKWLNICLSEDEYKTFHYKYTGSICRKLSEYARRVLLNKVVTVNQRKQSLDDFMTEMNRLRNELNAIWNNLN